MSQRNRAESIIVSKSTACSVSAASNTTPTNQRPSTQQRNSSSTSNSALSARASRFAGLLRKDKQTSKPSSPVLNHTPKRASTNNNNNNTILTSSFATPAAAAVASTEVPARLPPQKSSSVRSSSSKSSSSSPRSSSPRSSSSSSKSSSSSGPSSIGTAKNASVPLSPVAPASRTASRLTHLRHSSSVTVAPPTPSTSAASSLPSFALNPQHHRNSLVDKTSLANKTAAPHRSATAHPPSLSLTKKRSPARFSSNGIATSSGPPPSLAYRRTIAMEPRSNFTMQNGGLLTGGGLLGAGNRSSASSSTISAHQYSRNASSRTPSRRSSVVSESEINVDDQGDETYEEEEGDRTITGLENLQDGFNGDELPTLSRDPVSEDVFFNLARSDSVSSQSSNVSKSERRRARLYAHRSLPPDSFSPRGTRTPHAISGSPPGVIASSPPPVIEDTWRHSSPPSQFHNRRMSNASDYAEERLSITPRASLVRPLSLLRRENSAPSSSHSRSYSLADPNARSRTNGVPPRSSLLSSPNGNDRPLPNMIDMADETQISNRMERSRGTSSGGGGADDSASTVSTTATSTVWDELDDLKSRIRRLELTGRMPPSGTGTGNSSNSSGERPRTATTTITTVSSSPRHQGTSASGISPTGSVIGTSSTTTHPLLHSALAKSKPLISPEVFKYLEAAANDAVALAGVVGSTGTPGITTFTGSGSIATDRLVRRKADSVCRSLTELCIALSENRNSLQPSGFPPSRDYTASRPVSRETANGNGRESVLGGRESVLDRAAVSPKSYPRFAERKGSMVSLAAAAGLTQSASPRPQLLGEALPSPTTSSNLRNRNSMLLKNRMPADEEGLDRLRAPSRATGESLSHRLASREYASSQATERSSPNPSSILSRRLYTGSGAAVNLPSPTILGSGRRFLSTATERAERSETIPERPTFEFNIPANERMVNDRLVNAATNGEYVSNRYRSGSLNGNGANGAVAPGNVGRTGSRRMTRGAGGGLRESVEIDSSQQGGSLGRTPGAGERLLRR